MGIYVYIYIYIYIYTYIYWYGCMWFLNYWMKGGLFIGNICGYKTEMKYIHSFSTKQSCQYPNEFLSDS